MVSHIEKDIAELKDMRSSFHEEQLSLKYLVHFIGDVHMPLHVSGDNDAGGNVKKVRYFAPTSRSNRGNATNFHSLWDNLIEFKASEDPAELGNSLDRDISKSKKSKWDSGTIEDWAVESYSVAKNVIYPRFSTNPTGM